MCCVYRISSLHLQMLSQSPEMEGTDGDLDALIRKAQVMVLCYVI